MSHKDPFDTTYRKVHGQHVIGKDDATDEYNIIHIDADGHIYVKLLAEHAGAMQEVSSGEAAGLYVEEAPYTSRIDTGVSNTIYIGTAVVGTLTSAAKWQIQKVDTTVISITYADGDANFDNIWDDRRTEYVYS
jgi:hypothetical protein